MKHFYFLLILAIMASFASAQDDYKTNNDIQTIFSRGHHNGAYGAFTMGYSKIDGKDAFIAGGRGAFIINETLAIGLAGYGFVNDLDYDQYMPTHSSEYSLAGGYGGFFIEPIIASRLPVHITFPILFGVGGISRVDGINRWDNYIWDETQNDAFLILEPAVDLEFNLTRFFRAAITASYRITSDIELHNIDPDVLNGFSMGLTFKLGKF